MVRRTAPAMTIEDREGQLVALATDLAEKKLRDGSASSQIISDFIKLGTVKHKLELEKLKQENELLKAKTKAIESAERVEELYKQALNAMRIYGGSDNVDQDIY